jgi:hypothetical protein
MKKSIFPIVTELDLQLIAFRSIVDRLEMNDVKFVEQIQGWLKTTEDIFIRNNLAEVSVLAGYRSKILSPRFSTDRGMPVKKAQVKIAAESLFEIQQTVWEVLKPFHEKMDEARALIKQLLTIVAQTKVFNYSKDVPFENFIKDIWYFILSNEQLSPGAVKLKSTLTMNDITLLMAEEIELSDF